MFSHREKRRGDSFNFVQVLNKYIGNYFVGYILIVGGTGCLLPCMTNDRVDG